MRLPVRKTFPPLSHQEKLHTIFQVFNQMFHSDWQYDDDVDIVYAQCHERRLRRTLESHFHLLRILNGYE